METITYQMLDSETMEPSETGRLYRIIEREGGAKIYEAVSGKYDEENGIFTPDPEPEIPQQPSKLDQLEDENAFLALELAQTQARLDQAEQEQADLLLTLVMQGVI